MEAVSTAERIVLGLTELDTVRLADFSIRSGSALPTEMYVKIGLERTT